MTKIPNDLAFPRLCGLLADRPTRLSQAMHNAGFRALGLDFYYVAFDTTDTAGGLRAMRALGIRGLSLTIPHKESALPLVDMLSDDAKAAGSINTVINDGKILTGYNTDIAGVSGALDEQSFEGESAVVIGAGGAARAAILGLKRSGLKTIRITNRTDAKAKALAEQFSVDFMPWEKFGPRIEADILVNRTPAGSPLSGGEAGLELAGRCPCRKETAVFDMVTRQTPLLERASAAGAMVIPGGRMLLFQGLEQFRLFTGNEPPRKEMEAALRQALAV